MRVLHLIASPGGLDRWLDDCLASLAPTLARRATLVLPNHRIAHQLRRRLCLAGRAGQLAGVRIINAEEMAREVLLRAGQPRDAALDDLRVPALRSLVASGALEGRLEYLDLATMRRGRGYAEAVASSIAQCEAAGITRDDLRSAASAWSGADPVLPRRLRDLATLWEAADGSLGADEAGLSSQPGILLAAAAALARVPEVVSRFGQVFVLLGLTPSSALVRFAAAARPASVAVLAGRPVRESALAMIESIAHAFGATASASGDESGVGTSEVALVRRFLFAAPEDLARPGRPTSGGPDGTVVFEQHPGVRREIDAAVSWVLEEVSDRRTPLEEIALVVPARDPLASLLVAALERPDKGGSASLSIPAHVAGGLPLAGSASGTVLLLLLRALRDALSAERVVALLPHLRLTGAERSHVSEAEARRLAHGCGVLGGTPGNPARGREWPEQVRRRAAALRRQLAQIDEMEDGDPEQARAVLRRRDAERMLATIDALLPAIDALTALGVAVLDEAPLAEIVTGIRSLYRESCLVPPGPPDALAQLEEAVEEAAATAAVRGLGGRDAIVWLVDRLRALRFPQGRYGEARVFVGTPADVAGLRFRAVRVLGAVEGALPPTSREDSVLPDAACAWLVQHVRSRGSTDCRLPSSAERLLASTHAAFHAIAGAEQRLVLSAPRRWIDGSERELAGLVLEAAVALGRPDGAHAVSVPSTGQLRSLYVEPGTTARARRDREAPATVRTEVQAVADAAAGARRPVPPHWVGSAGGSPLDLSRLQAIAVERRCPEILLSDGALGSALGAEAAALLVPGIAPEKGTSASALATLLECPHRFLYERVLGCEPPEERHPVREIGQPYYGTLVHRVAEGFFREHGTDFCQRDRSLAVWRSIARRIARDAFGEFLNEYPLAAGGARQAQLARLERDVERLIEIEWNLGEREFVGAELPFGFPNPVRLDPGGESAVYVHGYVDRLDRTAAGYIVRDVKSGKLKSLTRVEVGPSPDLQIALYALVARSGALGRRAGVAQGAYVFPVDLGDGERRFAGEDLDDLLEQAQGWLGLAAALLVERTFPRAAQKKACRYCRFTAVCGPDPTAVSRDKLSRAHPESPGGRLLRLHAAGDEEDEADAG